MAPADFCSFIAVVVVVRSTRTVIFGNDSPLISRRIGFLATSIHRAILINVLNHLVHEALYRQNFRFIIDKIEWQINLLVFVLRYRGG
jgi:riboflavin transporter FmnP